MSFLSRVFSFWRNPHYARGIRYFNRREFSRALEEFEHILVTDRDRSNLDVELARFYAAEAHSKLGMDFFRLGDFTRAKQEFEAAIEVEGNFPDLFYYLGCLEERAGRYGEALPLLDRALELNPHLREALGCRALAHRGMGHEDRARRDLTRLAVSGFGLPEVAVHRPRLDLPAHFAGDTPPRPGFWAPLLRSLDHYDHGRLDEALEAMEEAVAAAPGYPDLRLRQGQILAEMNRHAEALLAFDAALERNSGFVEARIARGTCLLFLNRPNEAESDLERAAEIQPGYADVAFYRGLALACSGRIREGLRAVIRAVEINPQFWRAHFVIGQLHLSLGELESGVSSLQTALHGQNPFIPDWMIQSSRAREREGGAAGYWSTSVAAHPGYPDLRVQLGLVYLSRGHLPRAREEFLEAVRLNPGYVQAHGYLGKIELAAGNPEGAVEHLARAAELDPEWADTHCLLGEARLAAEDLRGAAASFRTALSLNPRYVDALLGLAEVDWIGGNTEDAAARYREVLAIEPEHPDARSRLDELGVEAGWEGALTDA